jgi:hypothetical protein
MSSLSKEERIQQAIEALQAGTVSSQRAASERFNVPRTTLRNRIDGMRSAQELHQSQQRLTPEEEEAIKRTLYTLNRWGWPATVRYLESLALTMLKAKGDHKVLGHHWYKNYLARHPDLKAIWSRSLDQARKDAVSHATLSKWFKLYADTCSKYGIPPGDRYNMDEKGFMRGIGDDGKVICPVDEIEVWSIQPGNREWVSVISCINAENYSLPLFIIFQGQRIQEEWIDPQIDYRTVIQVS